MNEFERYTTLHQELLSLLINARINLESAKTDLRKVLDIWTSNNMNNDVFNNPDVPEYVKEQLNQHRKFAQAYLQFLESTVDSGETIEQLLSERFYG